MKGCLAPSEIPQMTAQEASRFGNFAEDLITSEYRSRRGFGPNDIYIDNNNPAPYLWFLARHNPGFDQAAQIAYYRQVYMDRQYRRPDMLIHTIAERTFYEIKPDSTAGRSAGIEKVGILAATYAAHGLPYRPGTNYITTRIQTATYGAGLINSYIEANLIGPGLITYKLCLESNPVLDLATLAAILRYIIAQMLRQRGRGGFRPVDLEPAFARAGQLSNLAGDLGLRRVVATGRVGWNYFWKAVAKRFAVRGTAALALSAADGPLPVGELISLGLAIWTIVDIIRLSDELWADAAKIQQSGA